MNQADYKAIAEILRRRTNTQEHEVDRIAHHNICREIADYFEREENQDRKDFAKSQNLKLIDVPSRFNREQFLKACGVQKA